MKMFLVAALMVTVVSAAVSPLRQYSPTPAPYPNPSNGQAFAIVRSESDILPDGKYQYVYETSNGISAQQTGGLGGSGGPDAGNVAQGAFGYTSPEGQQIYITYTADENGFHPSGDALPTPPASQPIPPAIQRSLDYNAAHPEAQPTRPTARNYYQ